MSADDYKSPSEAWYEKIKQLKPTHQEYLEAFAADTNYFTHFNAQQVEDDSNLAELLSLTYPDLTPKIAKAAPKPTLSPAKAKEKPAAPVERKPAQPTAQKEKKEPGKVKRVLKKVEPRAKLSPAARRVREFMRMTGIPMTSDRIKALKTRIDNDILSGSIRKNDVLADAIREIRDTLRQVLANTELWSEANGCVVLQSESQLKVSEQMLKESGAQLLRVKHRPLIPSGDSARKALNLAKRLAKLEGKRVVAADLKPIVSSYHRFQAEGRLDENQIGRYLYDQLVAVGSLAEKGLQQLVAGKATCFTLRMQKPIQLGGVNLAGVEINLPQALATKLTIDNTTVDVWQEGDRLFVTLLTRKSRQALGTWWDEDARKLFSSGQFANDTNKLHHSVLEYMQRQVAAVR